MNPQLAVSSSGSSTKAIKLKTLVNSFATNDNSGKDEIYLSVFSDVMGESKSCGKYNFNPGDFVDFKDTVIPCKDYVVIGIREVDEDYYNTSSSVVISCSEGPKSVDLVVKETESSLSYFFSNLEAVIDFWAVLAPEVGAPLSIVTHLAGEFATVLADDERTGFYTLHIEGVSSDTYTIPKSFSSSN